MHATYSFCGCSHSHNRFRLFTRLYRDVYTSNSTGKISTGVSKRLTKSRLVLHSLLFHIGVGLHEMVYDDGNDSENVVASAQKYVTNKAGFHSRLRMGLRNLLGSYSLFVHSKYV